MQEQQYFVTELFTPSNFSPSFLPFLSLDLILYFIYFLPNSGFLYCHLLIPSLFCIQESQGGSSSRWLSPGRVTGGPYSPDPHWGWASVLRWGLLALCSQALYLQAEIKTIPLNETEDHFEMKKVFSRWNAISLCERHHYVILLFFETQPGRFSFSKAPLLLHDAPHTNTLQPTTQRDAQRLQLDHGVLGTLLLLIAGELRPKRLLGSRPPWSSSSNTPCPLPTISQLEGFRMRKLITLLQNNNIESSLSRLILFLWCSWKLIKNPKKSRSLYHPGGKNW